jgi:hypothetical protein
MAFHLTGEDRFVRRCEQEMLAAAGFADWNPSHFLDVAEMTLALAVGYDWLYGQLDESSRDTIREAIVEKGVKLGFDSKYDGWIRARNNWGQVCHGGLTAGALAVLEDHPELAARTIDQTLHNVTFSMAAFDPNGSYPEGPGYWCYGTSYNVLLIAALESVLGTDFGLSKAPGFNRTGHYPALVTGPSGQFFNYSDGGSTRKPQAALFWFANRYGRPDWLHGERQRWQSLNDSPAADAGSGSARLAPLALLWMGPPTPTAPVRIPLHWSGGGEVPITIHRSSWTDPDATFVGFKGGSPSANHGHMDAGSFVLDADGQRWAVDLGSESYHGIEARGMKLWDRSQDSDRWKIFRLSSLSHNTLAIDDQRQRASGYADLIQFSDRPDFPHSVIDLSSLYEPQCGSARRGVALLPSREVLIQDEISGLKPGSRVRWGLVTTAAAGASGQASIKLGSGEATLDLTILTPTSSHWQWIDAAQPRQPWDSTNPAARMVLFETVAPESGELTLTVLATPGSCRDSIGKRSQLRRLAEWQDR